MLPISDEPDAYDLIPKVELHCHVEGTVRPSTVIELARKAGRPLPVDDPAELYRYDSLDTFLAVFWLVQETLATREDWTRIAYESLVDGAAHGLRYREMFFTPARHLAAGQDLGSIVAGLSEGIEAAEATTGVRCVLVGDIDRAFGPAAGLEFVEQLGALRRSGQADRVVGVGADFDGARRRPAGFAPAFDAARRFGFRRTCHAGEAVGVGPGNIRVALDVLGAERIDHGVAIVEDPALVGRLAGDRIPLTVCPLSNVVIANRFRSLAEHPLRAMLEAGLLVTINTDDPALMDDDLGTEYRTVGEALGFGLDEMAQIARDGIEFDLARRVRPPVARSRVRRRTRHADLARTTSILMPPGRKAQVRARDLGIAIGRGSPGPLNSITDVAGVRVGHTTIVEGEGPLVVGRGPVRTGVTVVVPHGGDPWKERVFAGCHRLNGNGELTGLEWIREVGQLGGIVALTNTHSVGVVHDALIAEAVRADPFGGWSLPVVGETWDGSLNDINGFHVRPEHVRAAIESATGGPVAEGGVGGGTGMICHEFKGGIGTASRIADIGTDRWTVGVLVQANYGRREWLRVDGVPVGAEIGTAEVPSARAEADAIDDERERAMGVESSHRAGATGEAGSIIVLIATDAPLLPHQCDRLAQRAGLGIARAGGTGAHSSGDFFLAWATGNGDVAPQAGGDSSMVDLRMVVDRAMDPLFDGVIEATEEAILNALIAAETMTGRDGITAHALPHERLVEVMARFGRAPGSAG